MADPMWLGGPNQFQDEYPTIWFTFPQFMRDPLLPQTPPLSPGAMSLTCAALMMVPVIGANAAYFLGQYQLYYAAAYESSPPGSYTDTPITVDDQGAWEPPAMVESADHALILQILANTTTIWSALSPAVPPNNISDKLDTIITGLAALGGSGTPATVNQASLILAGIYYLAQLPLIYRITADDTDILAAIEAARANLDLTIDGWATNTQDRFDDVDADHATIKGYTDGVEGALATVDGKADDILEAIAAIEPGGGTPSGWPGLAGATLSNPVAWSAPMDHVEAMDGCIVHISAEPGGTGRHEVGSHTSWQHAGWLAFVSDRGDADELQWLNLGDAVYSPKRLATAAGVLLFPRAGSSGTLTPWTRNP